MQEEPNVVQQGDSIFLTDHLPTSKNTGVDGHGRVELGVNNHIVNLCGVGVEKP